MKTLSLTVNSTYSVLTKLAFFATFFIVMM